MNIKLRIKIFFLMQLSLLIFLFSAIGCNVATDSASSVGSTTSTDLSYPHSSTFATGSEHGASYNKNPTFCQACHGADLSGGTSKISCTSCHATHSSSPTSFIH